MLKNALIKAVLGTAFAAGALVTPGVVSGATPVALAAGGSCDYQAPATTSTTLDLLMMVDAGDPLTGSGEASTSAGSLPDGTVVVTVTDVTNGGSTTLDPVAVSAANPRYAFSYPTLGRGATTFAFQATYTTDRCQYQGSVSAVKNAVVQKGTPGVPTVRKSSGSSKTWTFTVPARLNGPTPTGSVTATYELKRGGSATAKVDLTAAGSTAAVAVPGDAKNDNVDSIAYSGDGNYLPRSAKG